MKRVIPVLAALAMFATAAPVDAATATPPRTVSAGVLWYTDVASTVVTDGPATITLTNYAYRHPEQVQAVLVVPVAGTYVIRDRCQAYVLPHTWVVYVDGVRVASSSLRCR